jgi:hypothetical protein
MNTTMTMVGVCGAMALALACVVPNPDLARGDEATTEGTTDESDPPASGTLESDSDGSGAESSADSSVDSSIDSSSSDSSSSDSSSNGDSSETGVATDDGSESLCPLVSEVADGCQTCVDLYCCEAVSLCQLEEDCTCLLDCLLTGSASTLCEATCGLGTGLPSLTMTFDCLDQHCSEDCPNML